VNAAYRLPAGTVLFGSYNHFYVPPPIENVLASSAGLTSLVSEIGRPLPPVRAIKENQFELGVTQPIAIKAGLDPVREAAALPYRIAVFDPVTLRAFELDER
jgi:hypothetical protein